MERLISFISGHFFIVVIVVGLIYMMFFRKSPLEKRPPNRMPDFGSGPSFPQRPRRPAAPSQPPVVQGGPPPVERRDPRPQYAEPPAAQPNLPMEPMELKYRLSIPAAPANAPSQAATVDRISMAPAIASTAPERTDSTLTREDLTRAVIWAEILGPPRSRRPFRR